MGAGRRAFAGTVVLAGVVAAVVVVVETDSGPPAPPDLTGRITLVQDLGTSYTRVGDRFRAFSVEPDGGDRRLLFGGDVYGLAVSPDGTRLAYCTTRRRGGVSGIAITRTDGAGGRLVGRARSDRFCERPSWSPDGRSVVFVRRGTTGLLNRASDAVLVVGTDGRGARTLLRGTNRRSDVAPAWSPDGRTIAVARGFGVTLVRAGDGRGARQLVPRRARGDAYAAPAFAPDGRTIAFLGRGRGGRADVYVIGVDGSGLRRLTHVRRGVALRDPAFSPDGRSLLYTRASARRPDADPDPRAGTTVVRYDLRTGRTSRVSAFRRGVVADLTWR